VIFETNIVAEIATSSSAHKVRAGGTTWRWWMMWGRVSQTSIGCVLSGKSRLPFMVPATLGRSSGLSRSRRKSILTSRARRAALWTVGPRGSGPLRVCTWTDGPLADCSRRRQNARMCAVCDFRKRVTRPCWMCRPTGPYPCPVGSACFERGILLERELCAVPLQKPGSNGASGPERPCDPSSVGFLSAFKDLTEFLSCAKWTDGSSRQLGTLLITWERGKWTLKLNDRELNRYAFYAANTLPDALAGVDLGLSADDLDWRDQKPFTRSK
jgi:hypothetical protein